MGLKRTELDELRDIISTVTADTPRPELEAMTVRLLALQTGLISSMLNELGSIGSALERMAGRM